MIGSSCLIKEPDLNLMLTLSYPLLASVRVTPLLICGNETKFLIHSLFDDATVRGTYSIRWVFATERLRQNPRRIVAV